MVTGIVLIVIAIILVLIAMISYLHGNMDYVIRILIVAIFAALIGSVVIDRVSGQECVQQIEQGDS